MHSFDVVVQGSCVVKLDAAEVAVVAGRHGDHFSRRHFGMWYQYCVILTKKPSRLEILSERELGINLTFKLKSSLFYTCLN